MVAETLLVIVHFVYVYLCACVCPLYVSHSLSEKWISIYDRFCYFPTLYLVLLLPDLCTDTRVRRKKKSRKKERESSTFSLLHFQSCYFLKCLQVFDRQLCIKKLIETDWVILSVGKINKFDFERLSRGIDFDFFFVSFDRMTFTIWKTLIKSIYKW